MENLRKRILASLLVMAIMVTMLPGNVYGTEEQKLSMESAEEVSDGYDILLNYVAIDKPRIEESDIQNIVVGYSSENQKKIDDAILYYENIDSGEILEIKNPHIDNDTIEFSYGIKSTDTGRYKISKITLIYGEIEKEILLSDIGIEAKYSVNCDMDTDADAYIVSDDTDITYESIDNDGNCVEVDSIEEAIAGASDAIAQKEDISLYNSGNVVVVLDPGHGGIDSGTVSNVNGVPIIERDINLKIAQYCKAELETYSGLTVYMTRTDNTSPNTDRQQRAQFAAQKGASVLVSIHINSAGTGYTNSHGAEIWYPNSNYNSNVSNQGLSLGNMILKQLTALGLANRGAKIRNSADGETYPDGSIADYLGINKYCKEYGFPGIIVEHAFANNVSDATNYLTTDAQLKKLGIADATGIANYFGLHKKKNVSLYGIYSQESLEGISAALSYATDDLNVKFRWMEYNVDKDQWKILNDWSDNSSVLWKPRKGNYWLSVDTLTSDGLQQNYTMTYYSNHDYTGKYDVRISGLYCYEGSDGVHAGAVHQTNDSNTKYRWLVYDLYRKNWRIISDWKSSEWVTWKPESGNYWLRAEALTSDGVEDDYTVAYNIQKDYTGINLNGIYTISASKNVAAALSYSSVRNNLEFRWMSYDLTSGQWKILKNWSKESSVSWLPGARTYWLSVDVRTNDGVIKNSTITYASQIDYTVKYINLNGIYCSESKYGISAGAVHQTNDDDVKYRWLYYNVDRANWYLLTDWQKSEWVDWTPDAGNYWLRVETKLSDGKENSYTIAYNVNKYTIMGKSDTSVKQMVKYYNSKATYPKYYSNTDAPTIEQFCQIYFDECQIEGVKAEVAFCQSMKETNFLKFTGDVDISQFNFAGIGATGNGNKGNSFENVRTGIRAQIQHLKAYASKEKLVNKCVDPRYDLMTDKGCAAYLEWLGMHENPQGKGWATAYNYGYSIRRDYMNVMFRY